MQYQVPQFIETEDTIIWRLTIKQFIMLAAAGLVSFFLYFALQFWLWLIVSIIVVGGGFALALVKVNGQPLSRVLRSMVNFYIKPQLYVWHPELTKDEASLSSITGGGFDLQKIVSGLALKNVWQSVQMRGGKPQGSKVSGTRYELFRKSSGEPRVANRVDYR